MKSINERVAEALGYQLVELNGCIFWNDAESYSYRNIPLWADNISKAMELLEGLDYVIRFENDTALVYLQPEWGGGELLNWAASADAKETPEAICLAFLEMKQSQPPTQEKE